MSWMKVFFLFFLSLAVLPLARGNNAAVGTSVLASVDGQIITLGDVLSESSGSEALAGVYAADQLSSEILKLRKETVDRLIDRKLLVAEFKRLNLVIPGKYVESMLDDIAENMGCKSRSELAGKLRLLNSSVEELREKAAERLMAEMVIGREFYAVNNPTPEDLNKYFEAHKDEFDKPERLSLALLLLPENTPTDTVDELQKKLQQDSRSFPELVKAFSCGPQREKGGDVGFIARRNLRSEFALVIPDGPVKAGQVYGPVKTPEGRYFIKITAVEPGVEAVFADFREFIQTKLENETRERALADLYKRLRGRAEIRYYFEHSGHEISVQSEEEKSIVTPEKTPEDNNIQKTEKKTMVTLKTNHGDIKLELFADAAPKTVANFLEYVKSGFYNGTLFHRVIDNFMIQGGGFDQNFKQKATRKPIENEADNQLSNEIGTIAMARTMDPHSATAQFFINVANNDFLDFRSPTPQFYGYCVFGKVVEGMDVVNKIKTVKTGGRAGHQDVPKEDVVIIEAVID